MAEDKTELDLNGEDLLSLLEIVQEQQDHEEQQKTASSGAAASVSSSSLPPQSAASADASSEDSLDKALQEALSGLDLDKLQAMAEAPAETPKFQNKSIDSYDKSVYAWSQLDEIKLGIDHGVDVSLYDDPALLFRQMREIRIGLEQGVDVTGYANKFYKDSQMREIRLGLMEHIDTTTYTRLIFSLPDMKKKHQDLLMKRYEKDPANIDFCYTDRETGITIYTEEGQMKAYIRLTTGLPEKYTKAKLNTLLYLYGVSEGVDLDGLDLKALLPGVEYQVAEGTPSVIGEEGHYEYFVANIGEDKPRIREDGSIDYRSQKVYASVREGERIALYHPATYGKLGHTVSGFELKASHGKNLKKLDVDPKIRLEADGVTYTATKDGFITMQGGMIKILDILEFNEDIGYANGNIRFDGNIRIRGNVQESAVIEAAGDIVIEGFVESATIKAGGDITISKGVNGNDKGLLKAEGSIVTAFLENAIVEAGVNVETGYILNSSVMAGKLVKTNGGKARIAGGRIHAIRGIETTTVGNEAHIRTELEVGRGNDVDERMKQILVGKKDKKDEIAKVRLGMNGILQKFGAVEGRTNPIYLKLQDALERSTAEMDKLSQEEEELQEELRALQKVYVTVKGTTYENTRITVNGRATLIEEKAQGATFQPAGVKKL